MGLCNPIEVVVIRRPAAGHSLPGDAPQPPARLSLIVSHSSLPGDCARQERDLDDLMGLLLCGRRRGVLSILAGARGEGRAEPISVGEIARRLGMSQKNLSQHLAPLRNAGLIYATRRGQCREYELTPGRVTCQQDPSTGRFQLQVCAAGGSGVSVTIGWAVPIPAAQQTAATGPP